MKKDIYNVNKRKPNLKNLYKAEIIKKSLNNKI